MKHAAAINTSEIGYFPRRLDEGNCTSTTEITIVTIALCFRTSRASLFLYSSTFCFRLRVFFYRSSGRFARRNRFGNFSCSNCQERNRRRCSIEKIVTLIDSDDPAFDWQNGGTSKLHNRTSLGAASKRSRMSSLIPYTWRFIQASVSSCRVFVMHLD